MIRNSRRIEAFPSISPETIKARRSVLQPRWASKNPFKDSTANWGDVKAGRPLSRVGELVFQLMDSVLPGFAFQQAGAFDLPGFAFQQAGAFDLPGFAFQQAGAFDLPGFAFQQADAFDSPPFRPSSGGKPRGFSSPWTP